MIGFRVVEHSAKPGVQVVEILEDGKVVGVLYPDRGKSIKLVSAHIHETGTDDGFAGEVVEDDGTSSWPPIPSVHITFDPSPYVIEGGRIKKIRPS